MHYPLRILSLAVVTGLSLTQAPIAIGAAVQYDRSATDAVVVDPQSQHGLENPRATPLKDRILKDGARQMNRDQVTAYLSDKTQQWANGGAFYHANGRLDFIWEGKEFNHYTWAADRRGLVCITSPQGVTTSCSLYYDYRDTVWTIVTEVFGEEQQFFGGPDTTMPGDRLADLEPWDPALSGK